MIVLTRAVNIQNETDEKESDNSEKTGKQNRLLSYREKYIRPEYGKSVLIYILDFQKMVACWLPGIRTTVYMTNIPESDEFKRPRKIFLIHVYEWNDTACGVIEISDEDFCEFIKTYEKYQKIGGEIYYRREKVGNRIKHIFDHQKNSHKIKKVKQYILFEKM